MHFHLALRGRHLIIIDYLCVILAFTLALALRLDAPSAAFEFHLAHYWWLLGPLLLIRIGTNLYFRLYQRLWRYASIEEMQAIVLATSVGSLLFGLLVLVLGAGTPPGPSYGFPRSVIGIESLLSLAFFGGSRFSLRVLQAGRLVAGQRLDPAQVGTMKRVLIVGAGDAGAMVVKELNLRPALGMQPVGFLDDDPIKRGHLIHGVKVVGNLTEIHTSIARLDVNGVVVAMPTAPGAVVRSILQDCQKMGISVMTVPGIPELLSGAVTISTIRPVQVEDLLRREPADVDLEQIARYLQGATVLVTGAGGSIGSELCRQIVGFHPSRLLLLGRGENSIYNIHEELHSRMDGCTELLPLIANVRDLPRIRMLMERHRPAVVFHAAAHKHVPLMEANPYEAIATNVLGTRNLLQAAAEFGVVRYVQVSTDKAVNPTNVMGASKRIGELMLQATAAKTGRPYVAVRFGNVLGSRGSVVPLFKRQIEAGGPVTVTDERITRYFMTIPEAVQLVIQAGAMGNGGEIFVLDMGKPVRVYDLALDLIRLSGLVPHRDIEIQVTGLRPGEKLYEEMFTGSEGPACTRNERIFVSELTSPPDGILEDGLREFEALVASGCGDGERIRAALRAVVPEYTPLNGANAQVLA